MPDEDGLQLVRTRSQSSISTSATADNLIGVGRTMDNLLQRVGKRIESLLNRGADRLGMGPTHVAQEIRILCRHEELQFYQRCSLPPRQLSEKERDKVKKRCKKLLEFVESRVLSTQLAALDELTALAIEDSLIRTIFSECGLGYLEPKYEEPDVFLRNAKALASIEEIETHGLWHSLYSYYSSKLDLFSCGIFRITGEEVIKFHDLYGKSLKKSLLQENSKLFGNICRVFVMSNTENQVLKKIILRWDEPFNYRRPQLSLSDGIWPLTALGSSLKAWEVAELKYYSSPCVELLSKLTDSEDIDKHICHLEHFSDLSSWLKTSSFSYWRTISRAMEILSQNAAESVSQVLAERLTVAGGSLNRYCRLHFRREFEHMFDKISETFRIHSNETICLDVVLFNSKEVIYIEIDEQNSFDATGHFPILAGYDEFGRALYLAEVYDWSSRYLTRVLDGSSFAVFEDEHGVSLYSETFGVFVLRFDPVDYRCGHSTCCGFEGAMDPTGPLHWRRVWPVEDPILQSSMDLETYGYLKQMVDECTEDVRLEATYKEQLESDTRETQNLANGYSPSIEDLQYFSALPFAENHAVAPIPSDGGRAIDEPHQVISINEINGPASIRREPGILSDRAAISKTSNEEYFASDDLEVELEPLSKPLESRQGPEDASHIVLPETERSEAHDDGANSATCKAGASEEEEHEGDAKYWKQKFLQLQEENAALRARHHDTQL
ncbi:hypothetical protein SCHPADRAFT_894811 [Schizopora paradoxa]|uniref:Uncharacterized protein n=1 Tax=Schizopora paradoxa TaxID=27342 RepID=A0A0H2R7B7_9AGAM|nr:hypothetical protein SCHPADRAFT_894811 [Schizopora paradoxa]